MRVKGKRALASSSKIGNLKENNSAENAVIQIHESHRGCSWLATGKDNTAQVYTHNLTAGKTVSLKIKTP
ncbi:hypothetical protein GCM10027190_55480 [Spirosoma areae]